MVRLPAVLTAPEAGEVIESHSGATPIATDAGWLFVYEGRADDVELVVMEDRFPPVGPMVRTSGGDVWHVEVECPADALVEYKFGVTREGRRRLLLDPRNPNRARDPFGSNSVAAGPEYRAPGWLGSLHERGEFVPVRVESDPWNRAREHMLYFPPGHDGAGPAPLLILHDGMDYVEYAGLERCVSALTSGGRIPSPIILLHSPGQRHTEYSDNPRHVAHVIDELLPMLRREHEIDRVIAGGASLGGIASVSMAHRRPGSIDGLMLQSASMVRALGGPFHRGRVLAPASRLTAEILAARTAPAPRIAMSCGTFDGLVEDHRTLVPELEQVVPEFSYEEINAGHHWACWRDRLEPDLIGVLT